MSIDTLYADHNQLLAWFLRAKPGHTAIYAKGSDLDGSHPVFCLVMEWRAAGAVDVEEQDAADGTLHIVRVAGPFELQAQPAELDTVDRKVLTAIQMRLDAGRAAPSLSELAVACGLRNRQAARYRIRKLEERGLIKRVGSGPDRRVAVIDST